VAVCQLVEARMTGNDERAWVHLEKHRAKLLRDEL
jgi:hypothetical protein